MTPTAATGRRPPRRPLSMVQVCSAPRSSRSRWASATASASGCSRSPLERGWNRETFAFALAVQNLAWGLAGRSPARWPTAGARSASSSPAACSMPLGLVVMGWRRRGAGFLGGAGVLIGMAQAGTTYAVVYGVIGRNVAPEKRSWAMGVAAAAGSFGQFLMVPIEGGLIGASAGRARCSSSRCAALAIVPLAFGLREPRARRKRSARRRASAPRCARRSATAASSCSPPATSSAASRSSSSACTCRATSRTTA